MSVGRVLRPHGVRGDLLVDAYSDELQAVQPESEVFLGSPGTSHTVISVRPHQGRFLLKVSECVDRTQAEQFRGLEVRILMNRVGPLPAGVYYHRQILGLQVIEVGGRVLGEVGEILETGGNDVYVVRAASGAELLLPAISSVILDIDLEKGQIQVAIPQGLEERN
ncbi:MAG: ribosome maturation factor RimM [Anaerolineales bacterium]